MKPKTRTSEIFKWNTVLLLLICCSFFSALQAATFQFNPTQPMVGQTVTVRVTDTTPWAYVNVVASGPNTVSGVWGGVVDNHNGSWTWTWTLSGLQAGNYNIQFTSDNGVVRAQTTLAVATSNTASFSFNPSSPAAGQVVTVNVTDSTPYVYVDVQATGPNTVNGTWVGVVGNGNGTWTWTWTFSGLQQGNYTVKFYSDSFGNLRGQTSLYVSGTPALDDALFQFDPPNPLPGQAVNVKVMSRTPYSYIGLNVKLNGMNIPVTEDGYISNDDYYAGATNTWKYKLPALQAGNYVVSFTADYGAELVDQTTLPVQSHSMPSVTNSPFGFNGHFWWTYNCGSNVGDRIQRFINEYAALGATTIRIGVDWRAIEPNEGTRSYAYFDDILTRFNNAGITVIVLFYTAPAWATDDGGEWDLGKKLNRDKAGAMQATAMDMANHYPFVHHWEFWNEPHFKSVMTEGEEFAFWFKKFSVAIKSVRFSDKVSFGTIISLDNSQHTGSFVKNVMSALEGYQPDAISLHPYSGSGVNTAQIESVHNIVPHIPLWITEYGWNNYTEENQRDNLESAINWMRTKNYIEFSTMHMLHDWDDAHETHCDFSDDGPGQERYGLVTLPFYQGIDYHRKLAWYKFRELALGTNICTVPTNPTAGSVTSNSALISWNTSAQASEYQVAYKPSADVSGWIIVNSTSGSVAITGLSPGTQYVYLIRANCPSSGWTDWTPNAYFTTTGGCLPPTGLWSGSITSSSASISWNPVGGASEYNVAYKPSAAVSGWLYVNVTTNYTNLTGLTSGTPYVFVVRANCTSQGGWTEYSANAYFTTLSICSPPTGLSASNITNSSATVAWAGMSGATQYQVAYKPSADYDGWQYVTVTTNSVSLSGLASGKQYVVVVMANCPNGGGWTPYSSNYYFTTTGTVSNCSPPTGISAGSITHSSAFLSWTSISGATQYQVAYKPSADYDGWQYKTTSTNSTNLTGLAILKQYVVVVAANCPNGGGWTAYSSNYYFTTTSGPITPFSVQVKDSRSVEIFPNPMGAETLQISLPMNEDSKVVIRLMDQTGEEIDLLLDKPMESGTHQLTFDLPQLKPGLYMLRIVRGSSIETHKFIKQ